VKNRFDQRVGKNTDFHKWKIGFLGGFDGFLGVLVGFWQFEMQYDF